MKPILCWSCDTCLDEQLMAKHDEIAEVCLDNCGDAEFVVTCPVCGEEFTLYAELMIRWEVEPGQKVGRRLEL